MWPDYSRWNACHEGLRRKWKRRRTQIGVRVGGMTVWKAKGRLSYPGKGSQNGILWFPASTQTRLPFLPPFCRHSRWKGCFTGCHRLFNRPRMFCTNTDGCSFFSPDTGNSRTHFREIWLIRSTVTWITVLLQLHILYNTNSAMNLNVNIIHWEDI